MSAADGVMGMVATAMKAKSPIVGIPQPGGAPFRLRRALLRDSLKGLTVIDAGIQLALDGKPENTRLVVYATGPRVQAIRKFVPLADYTARFEQWLWTKAERERRTAPPKVRQTARAKELAKLRKRLDKLGEPRPPVHPFLVSYNDTAELIRERDARELEAWAGSVADGYDMERPRTLGGQWADWKRQANVRRWVQLQARLCKAGKFNTAKLYERLYIGPPIAGAGSLRVRKWSELNTHDRERCGDLYGYLGRLWEFSGLDRKPDYFFKPEPAPNCGPELYAAWLLEVRERGELKSIIAGIEAAAGDGEVRR